MTNFFRFFSISTGRRLSPSNGPPGANLTRKKTEVMTIASVTIEMPSRLIKYFNMD